MRPIPGGRVLAVAGACLLPGACIGPDAPPERKGAPVSHTVEIRDMVFRPEVLRAEPGDTVMWVNRDLVPHTATARDASWTSPSLDQGERWSLVVGKGHELEYLCDFHPVMRGRIVEKDEGSRMP